MKKILFAACFVLVSSQVSADEKTLFAGEAVYGGFGGPVLKVSRLKGETALFMGGRGGWLINHKFSIGGGGYGQVLDIKAPEKALPYYSKSDSSITDLNLSFGYGGVIFEYIGEWENLVHYSFNALIGAGDISYHESDWEENHNNGRSDHFYKNDTVFVLEPGINAELNVIKRIRINAGISYLLVSGLTLNGLNASDVGGLGAAFMIKFGKF